MRDETDRWVTFLFHNPRGYLDDIVDTLGKEETENLQLGGIIRQGCSATRRTYGITSFGKIYVCEWIMASSRQPLKEVEETFRNNYHKIGNMYDGRKISDKEIPWKKIRVGDVVLVGDMKMTYVTVTEINKNGIEYIDKEGYYKEIGADNCRFLVKGQKNTMQGELIKIKK